MDNKLVSVIIPVYNVEKYLKRCLDSVVCQSFRNLDILLIDDGSTDDCPQICDEYAARDSRIKVVHKKNGGLSDARNVGIDSASGNYLCFVDSDDVVHPDFVLKLLNAIEVTRKKIAVCLFENFSDDCKLNFEHRKKLPVQLNVEESIDYYCELNPSKSTAFISSCTKMYSRELFSNIRFPVGEIYEDGLVSYRLIDHAGGVAFLDEPLYGYYMRADSIMGVKEKHSYKSVLAPYKNAIEYFENSQRKNIAAKFYPPMLMREIYRYWVAKIVERDPLLTNEILRLYKEDVKEMSRHNCSLKMQIIFKMLALCPWIYCTYRKFLPGVIGGR